MSNIRKLNTSKIAMTSCGQGMESIVKIPKVCNMVNIMPKRQLVVNRVDAFAVSGEFNK
jgi:hypothetical protein